VTAAALGSIKFAFSRSYYENYFPALVTRACALLFPDPEGLIYEAGFHSVRFILHLQYELSASFIASHLRFCRKKQKSLNIKVFKELYNIEVPAA